MANLWKIGREARRLRQQLSALAEVFTEPHRQRRYDADRLAHLAVSQGRIALHPKIALLVIYQPAGLQKSTLHTCRHLIEAGYAPFVVSNGPLSDQDRNDLEELCWKVAERPNYGYDFGAYRDGVLALLDWKITPETLLILNDSIWFPLYERDDLLDRLENHDADIAGTILRHRPKSRRSGTEGSEIRFLESYCYRVSGDAFRNSAFGAFWRAYRMTDNKYKVIRRGERDFSLSMQRAGMSVAAVLTEENFLAVINGFGAADLHKTVLYGAHADETVRSEQEALLSGFSDTPEWRSAAFAHIGRALKVGVFNSAFCYPTIWQLGANCLKKSRERINVLWRERYLAAVRAGDLPAPVPEIMDELSSGK